MKIAAEEIKSAARKVGFDACGIAPAAAVPLFASQLDRWIGDGCHGAMHYMEQYRAMRADPRQLLPGARSVVSLLLGYKPSQTMKGPAKIAMYAYGEDYHRRIKRMLYQLIAELQHSHPDFSAKPCVDTVPISDKLWAWQAGLGWIGKNTLLVNPQLGSLCNIAELVTDAEVDAYDSPMDSRCGDCSRCVDACPNHALVVDSGAVPSTDSKDDGMPRSHLVAPRCTSYNTVENRDAQIPEGQQGGGYAFGCDICQLVCPYNREAAARVEVSAEQLQSLQSLADADEPSFRRQTRPMALSRINFAQWQRNVQHAEDKPILPYPQQPQKF